MDWSPISTLFAQHLLLWVRVYDQNNYQNIPIQKWTQTWLKRFIAITVSSVCPELTELCHQMSKTWIRINVRVVSMGWTLSLPLIASALSMTERCLIAGLLTQPYMYDPVIYSHPFAIFLKLLISIYLKRFEKLVECQRRVKCQSWVQVSIRMCGHRFVHLLTTIRTSALLSASAERPRTPSRTSKG